MKNLQDTALTSLGRHLDEPASDGPGETSQPSEPQLNGVLSDAQAAEDQRRQVIQDLTTSNPLWQLAQASRPGTSSSQGFWHPQVDGRSFVLPATMTRPEESEKNESYLKDSQSPKSEELGSKKVGIKNDDGKPALDLIPREALEGLGRVLAFGAKKYSAGNWAKGIEYSRLIAAAIRHISAYASGEDTDPESGLSHVHHALCNLAFLSYMIEHRKDLDNRWSKS